ncbi:MAG: FliH/SctL family protein [Motiliproteus sp.]
MKKTKTPGRIAAKDLPPIKSWSLPKVKGSHVVRSPFKDKDQPDQVKETLIEELADAEPLTVEAIERIRQQARDEAYKKGYQEGHEKGEQEGRAKGDKLGYDTGLKRGEAEINRLQKQLGALIKAIESPLAEQYSEMEEALLRLVSDAALVTVKSELNCRPELLRQAIQDALAALPHGEVKLCFTVNPGDQAQLEQIREREHADWIIRADAEVSAGGFLVKGAHSYLDYSVENRFTQVITQVLSPPEQEAAAGDE